jgi:hypothetical protein
MDTSTPGELLLGPVIQKFALRERDHVEITNRRGAAVWRERELADRIGGR